MAMSFPVVPLGISVAVAAADGWVASMDVNNGRTQLSRQRTLWVQGGAVAAGLIGEFADWHPDITEPLMFTGAALFSREVAFKLAQSGRAVPVAPQGLVRSFVPAAPQIGAMARGDLVGHGAAGWAVDQQTGSVA